MSYTDSEIEGLLSAGVHHLYQEKSQIFDQLDKVREIAIQLKTENMILKEHAKYSAPFGRLSVAILQIARMFLNAEPNKAKDYLKFHGEKLCEEIPDSGIGKRLIRAANNDFGLEIINQGPA